MFRNLPHYLTAVADPVASEILFPDSQVSECEEEDASRNRQMWVGASRFKSELTYSTTCYIFRRHERFQCRQKYFFSKCEFSKQAEE